MRKGLVALLLALSLVVSCRRGGDGAVPKTRGPIIVISIDTLRSDRLPAYGYKSIRTPAIDALRADSILYERAYAHAPLTLPSHAALFTGQLPAATGIHDNGGFKLKQGIETLAGALKKQGYTTGAAVSSYALRASTGINRGFDFYDDAFIHSAGDQAMTDIQRKGEETAAVAEAWIAKQPKKKPFFFFFHIYEPHTPYEPTYDADVVKSDAVVGRLIAFLKKNDLYDDATIVLLSDHGEGLGEHGEDEHGVLLNRESLQVPLLLKLPDARQRNTSNPTSAQLADVYPTLLSLVGAKTANVHGTSLLQLTPAHAVRPIFAETYFPSLHLGWSDLHSVIQDRHHLIRGTRTELFDVVADPAETKDIAREHRRVVAALNSALEPHVKPVSVAEQISPEEAKKLAALGYLGSAPAAGDKTLDPRDHIKFVRDVRQASGLVDERKFDQALTATDALLARYPKMPDLWLYKTDALAGLGRNVEAVAAAKRGLAVNPMSDLLAIRVADLSARSGKAEEAREHAQLVLSRMPAEGHAVLARVAFAEGNLDLAASEAQQAANADPNKPLPHAMLGRIALARRDPRGALSSFDRAIAIAQRTKRVAPYLHVTRGVALMELGRKPEAEAAFREEIKLFPNSPDGYWNLLVFFINENRHDDAEQLIAWLFENRANPHTYAMVADAFLQTRRLAAAQQVARDGLMRFPDDANLKRIATLQPKPAPAPKPTR